MKKKVWVSVPLVLLACLATYGQVKFAAFGGLQATTARYKISGVKQETDFKVGYHAGVAMKVFFDKQLYFAPSVYYSMRGYKVDLNRESYPPSTLAINNNTSFHSLDLLPALQFDFSDQPSHFFLKAGPSLEFAFYGREKFTELDGTRKSRPVKFSLTSDYGFISSSGVFQFGYESKGGLILFLHYAHGLGNIINETDGPDVRHQAIGLSLGVYF